MPREILKIVPTEKGFDVVIPEGIEITEAAEKFVEAVRMVSSNKPVFKPIESEDKSNCIYILEA